MKNRIEGSAALVTGASRGLGRAIVEALLLRDAKKVYATARDPMTVEALKDKYGSRVVPLRLDVTSAEQIAEVVRSAPDVDLLFGNAGVAQLTQLTTQTVVDQARHEMEVNYFGNLRLLRDFADIITRRRGTVVIISSVTGLTNQPAVLTYSASKAALHSLTQGARLLLSPRGVRVVGVYPGPLDTDMTKGLQLEKAAPEEVANNILDGVEAGSDDIFPDPFAVAFGEQFQSSPKDSERQIAAAV
jgi:NAD(P)-dependent dehydrogenase (short-subunit alcohol dehydrogenase family)